MLIKGKALVYGDKIDTDVIIPAKYLKSTDPEFLGQHAMEPIDPNFYNKARQGVILVAGKAFGMGSSREQAAIALKAAGVKAIVAESFARIFFRNAINNGLPVITASGISKEVKEGDIVEVNVETGEIAINGEKRITGKGITGMALDILKSGGLLIYLKGNRTKR
jgi:3-isopropylmalate/(R)-2-methylmalate dehydratase small subunit